MLFRASIPLMSSSISLTLAPISLSSSRAQRWSQSNGYTLIELITTLFITVLLALMCFGSYSHLVKKNEALIIFDEINTVIEMAKIQAMKLSKTIYITPIDSASDWSKGLKLSYFDNGNKILYLWQWHHPQWRLEWKGTHTNQEIIFNYPIFNSISNGQFHITNVNTMEKDVIVLNRLGRVRRIGTE